MKTLAIIPARAGSKRMPNKNMADLCGHPLIWWTVRAALDARVALDGLVITSDSPEICGAFADEPGVLIHHRRTELALDDTPMIAVVRDVIEHFVGWDVAMVLQPTSPLRSGADIHNALGLMEERNADSVISVTEAPYDAVFEMGHADRLHRPPISRRVMVPNGAIHAIRIEWLTSTLKWDWWNVPLCYGYVMPPARSIDINTAGDLDAARAYILAAANVGES